MAVAPAATSVWAVVHAGDVLAGRPVVSTLSWVPGLDLSLNLRMDVLSLLMVALVAGVGTLVIVYCAGYFEDGKAGTGQFAGVLTAFANTREKHVVAGNVMKAAMVIAIGYAWLIGPILKGA